MKQGIVFNAQGIANFASSEMVKTLGEDETNRVADHLASNGFINSQQAKEIKNGSFDTIAAVFKKFTITKNRWGKNGLCVEENI